MFHPEQQRGVGHRITKGGGIIESLAGHIFYNLGPLPKSKPETRNDDHVTFCFFTPFFHSIARTRVSCTEEAPAN